MNIPEDKSGQEVPVVESTIEATTPKQFVLSEHFDIRKTPAEIYAELKQYDREFKFQVLIELLELRKFSSVVDLITEELGLVDIILKLDALGQPSNGYFIKRFLFALSDNNSRQFDVRLISHVLRDLNYIHLSTQIPVWHLRGVLRDSLRVASVNR